MKIWMCAAVMVALVGLASIISPQEASAAGWKAKSRKAARRSCGGESFSHGRTVSRSYGVSRGSCPGGVCP